MICYIDSSVVLRKFLRETGVLAEWPKIRQAFASRLLRLECLRTIERLQQRGVFDYDMTTKLREAFFKLLGSVALLPVTDRVIQRAEQPFATPLGTLDALHLSTALLWRETRGQDFYLATHDQELAQAARAHGLTVIGV